MFSHCQNRPRLKSYHFCRFLGGIIAEETILQNWFQLLTFVEEEFLFLILTNRVTDSLKRKSENSFVAVIVFLSNLSLSSASSVAHPPTLFLCFFFILTLPSSPRSSFPSVLSLPLAGLIPSCPVIFLSLLRVCHLPLSVPPGSPFLLLLLG